MATAKTAKTPAAKPLPMTNKAAPAGKITLQQAYALYNNSPADKAADMMQARKLMASHNKKVK
jgi:hypothetical protein